jgi:quercetin dioxygenase-like cupin family protein
VEYFTWESVPLEVMSDMISRKVISGDKAMVSQVFLKKGAVVPEHQHESEQITYILDGALKFQLEGREVIVHKGEVLRIPTCRIAPLRWKILSISIFLRPFGSTG